MTISGLIQKEFTRIKSDKRTLILLFAIPMILIIIFGLTTGVGPTKFFTALILLSTGNIVILFLFPNLVFGFLSPNRNIAVVNSIIHLVITIILFAYSSEPAFGYIILGHLPLTLIFSLFFLFIGIRSSSKRFLKK